MQKPIKDMTNGEYLTYLRQKHKDDDFEKSLLTEHELNQSFYFTSEKETKSTKNS